MCTFRRLPSANTVSIVAPPETADSRRPTSIPSARCSLAPPASMVLAARMPKGRAGQAFARRRISIRRMSARVAIGRQTLHNSSSHAQPVRRQVEPTDVAGSHFPYRYGQPRIDDAFKRRGWWEFPSTNNPEDVSPGIAHPRNSSSAQSPIASAPRGSPTRETALDATVRKSFGVSQSSVPSTRRCSARVICSLLITGCAPSTCDRPGNGCLSWGRLRFGCSTCSVVRLRFRWCVGTSRRCGPVGTAASHLE